MIKRNYRAEQAQRTLEILEAGEYRTLPSHFSRQKLVQLPSLAPMQAGTRLFTPTDQTALLFALQDRRWQFDTRFEVTAEDTISAIHRLTAEAGAEVTALNFASAKNAGGGFLGGAKAQEEHLCHCSALYLSLTTPQAVPYYAENRATRSALYTNHLIYSPRVPVYRSGMGKLLETPITANFITAPAPNAGAVAQSNPELLPRVLPTLRERAALVLGVAAAMGQTRLVLGAWGCGVFRNDPTEVALVFHDLLTGQAAGAFEEVTFAVFDGSKERGVLRAFEDVSSFRQ